MADIALSSARLQPQAACSAMPSPHLYRDLSPDLRVDATGGIRIVRLNRPDRLNSIDGALHGALVDLWRILGVDDDARAVVLTGVGTAFSAGGDLDALQGMHDEPSERRHVIRESERLARAMIHCEIPVVAAVNGPAVGLGATLVVLSDLVVMNHKAFISDPHVNVGVVAGDGSAGAWTMNLPLPVAKEFLLLGRRLDATDCDRLGVAYCLASPEAVLPTALRLAERIAGHPAAAIKDTKRTLNMHMRESSDRVLDFGLAAESDSMGSADMLAAISQLSRRLRPPV